MARRRRAERFYACGALERFRAARSTRTLDRMKNALLVASTLAHDGDGVVRFVISASSEDFAASTETIGGALTVQDLADALRGFPTEIGSSVHFRFGGLGKCELNFLCLNRSGHTAVRIAIEAPDGALTAHEHERAEFFFRVEPTAIEAFAEALSKFTANADNQAVLQGRPRYE